MSWLRIASLQISFHPATTLEYTDFLSEPYIDAQGNHLLPHCAPKGVEQNIYTDIKQRIRSVYVESFKQRLTVLLDQCKEWEVEIALLPEYSVPWELLEYIANRYPTMCIVAGTHLVERSTLLSGTFRKLQLEDSKLPKPGNAVCPILFDKRLIALVSKIMPAQPERVSLLPGEIWLPVEIPGKSLPFGVLICLDFLFQRSQKHIVDILPQLNDCRYLVVPSLTREHSVPEFHAKLAEEVKRYGHPVIYSNISYGGGTTIGVDCGIHTPELSFPATIGVLPAKEEGVVVSDVNFSLRTLGPSTRYSDSLIAKPFALASLIYTNTEVGKNYEESIAPLNSIMKTDKADLEKLEQISSRIRQSGGFIAQSSG